ncbi:MAG: ribose 5-phosphate isomerase A [Candidatus Nitrosocosmicus sp.]|nr:ribose 5-phosphate isomerase A [Candidatus Nitrosocosmicus sp.]MDN5867153.1 ribose 5-phosphate isomerase A [Candidatus Nitrosocosmicus sp.]
MSSPTSSSQNIGSLDKSFENIAQHIIENHISNNPLIIGLGSGRAIAKIVNLLPSSVIERCKFICTSLQIKIEAEKKKLSVIDESLIPFLDLVIDGADQIDSKLFMIKGGGGALFREKILYYSSKKTIIVGDVSKFVPCFSRSVPLEILPFGRTATISFLDKLNGAPILRTLEKGYPYITENGNLILDVMFSDYSNVLQLETKLKKIPGIIETGFFIQPPSVCYCALESNQYKVYESPPNLTKQLD